MTKTKTIRYGEKIYTYKDDVDHLIGKKVVANNYYRNLAEKPRECNEGVLLEKKDDYVYPFFVQRIAGWDKFQFIREIIEDKPRLMTNRQLVEWLARGNGEKAYKTDGEIDTEDINAEFSYNIGEENNSADRFFIRRWNSTEWILPTVDIYKEDCE